MAGRQDAFGCDAGVSSAHTSRLADPAVSVKVVRHIRAIYFCGKVGIGSPGIIDERIEGIWRSGGFPHPSQNWALTGLSGEGKGEFGTVVSALVFPKSPVIGEKLE